MLVIRWPNIFQENRISRQNCYCYAHIGHSRGKERFRTNLLARSANGHIVLVSDDADLVHQSDLLLIVAGQCLAGGIDVWEKTKHGLSRNRLRRGGGNGCRHCGSFVWDATILSIRKEKKRKEIKGRLLTEKKNGHSGLLRGDGYQA